MLALVAAVINASLLKATKETGLVFIYPLVNLVK